MAQRKFDSDKIIGETRYFGSWLKLLGIAKMIQGAFLVMTVFGAAFGAAFVWEGILLTRAANGSREVSAGKMQYLGKETLHPLKIYFIIEGVIIVLVFTGAIFGLFVLAGLIGTGFFAGLIELLKNF